MTEGRFVRCPPGTPCVHFPTHFYSRDWTSDERDPLPPLGEWEGKRVYDTGRFDEIFPSPQILGKPDCIIFGEPVYPPSSDRAFRAGFDVRCWQWTQPAATAQRQFPISDRAFQSSMIDVQVLLYDDPAAAQALLENLLGSDYVVTRVDNDPDSLIPGSLIAVSPYQNIIIVSGTTTPQQLAQQFILGVAPLDFGHFATQGLHYTASVAIHERLVAAGGDSHRPTLLIGHSYGGAVAIILAVRYAFGRTKPDLQLLTYAAPQTVDARGIAIIHDVPQVHLVNTGDPVPTLPPHGLEILPFLALPILPLVNVWETLDPCEQQWHLTPDGQLFEQQASALDLWQAYRFIRESVLTHTIAPVTAHGSAEYQRRLALTPP